LVADDEVPVLTAEGELVDAVRGRVAVTTLPDVVPDGVDELLTEDSVEELVDE